MQPDVSFIVAAYNAEASIARAIESALAQRDVTVEVIVADDCSRDRTAEIAASYTNRQVKLVSLPVNAGPGGARNAALAVARGRWLAILDADDTVRPERLARMLERAERQQAQIVVDNLDVVQEITGVTETMFDEAFLSVHPEIGLAAFIRSNVLFRSKYNFGYMKPVFERAFVHENALSYDETLRIGEDYVFLACALAAGGRCAVEPASGYVYNIRNDSISRVLELHHVHAMMAADAAFQRWHALDAEAGAALAERRRSLREAASFLSIIRHLKARAPVKALGAALSHPGALRHFGMPIRVRLRRIGLPVPEMRNN